MGSMIHLAVGKLELDWGKNNGYSDHSALFQKNDITQVPYHYVDNDGSTVIEYKEGLSKPLNEVLDRIKLLGYTKRYVQKDYEYNSALNSYDTSILNLSQLSQALSSVDVNTISPDYGDRQDFGKFFRRYLFDKLKLEDFVPDPHEARFKAAYAMENLSAYSLIHLLSANSSAQGLPVTWQYADIEYGGWAHREAFVKDLDPVNRFLIVTEGSSDANIIRNAFALLKPHLADFFHYVDTGEGYPFTGTGSQLNFTRGLKSIQVQNNIVILFDNDAEGVSSLNKTLALKLPPNMRAKKLPDLDEFKYFDTIGPSGRHAADINGKAVSIECFLDLGANPSIRWSSFNKDLDVYQGALEYKTEYAARFIKMREREIGYDYSKINFVLETIVDTCIAMREAEVLDSMDREIALLTGSGLDDE